MNDLGMERSKYPHSPNDRSKFHFKFPLSLHQHGHHSHEPEKDKDNTGRILTNIIIINAYLSLFVILPQIND